MDFVQEARMETMILSKQKRSMFASIVEKKQIQSLEDLVRAAQIKITNLRKTNKTAAPPFARGVSELQVICTRSIIFRMETMTAIITRMIFSPNTLTNFPITFAEKVIKSNEKMVQGS